MINNISLNLEKRISVSGTLWEKRIKKTDTDDSQILKNSNLDYILETILYGRKIQKDEFDSCLLYTSPSPRDIPLSRMPSSA